MDFEEAKELLKEAIDEAENKVIYCESGLKRFISKEKMMHKSYFKSD